MVSPSYYNSDNPPTRGQILALMVLLFFGRELDLRAEVLTNLKGILTFYPNLKVALPPIPPKPKAQL